jgi:Cytochrome bd terminal oxidase subunit II
MSRNGNVQAGESSRGVRCGESCSGDPDDAGSSALAVSIFSELCPRVMVSSTNPACSLTIHNSGSGSYSLKVMTVVVAIFLPVVLVYTAWTYYVFRRRLSDKEFGVQQTAH